MDLLSRIKIKENELVHGSKKTVYELADHVNKSHNYLCRISSVSEDLNFPIEIAVPLMQFTKNYDLLKLVSWECGYAPVKLPGKLKAAKKDENEMASDYQHATASACSLLIVFINNPSLENHNRLENALKNIVEESLKIKNYAAKKISRQEELF